MMVLYEISPEQLSQWIGIPEVLAYANISAPIIAALWDGEPTCFVGLIPLQDDAVYIWMYDLPLTKEHRVATARHARDLITRAKRRYTRIVGHCDSRSIRWLRSLGAILRPDGITFEISQ